MSRPAVVAVVVGQLAALVSFAWLVGDYGWDDGAITLAFSRTFAQHGTIALTPSSETVEGFSSLSWFLLNALVALARPSYATAVFLSQLAASLSLCVATVLLAKTCKVLKLGALASACTVVAFATWGASFAETANGMEMGLLTASFLALMNEFLRATPRFPIVAASTVLVLLTRYEAVAYVGAVGLALLAARRRKEFWVLFAVSGVVVLGATAWRLAVFGDFLPNTIRAKMWPPYLDRDFASLLRGRLWGASELLRFFGAPGLLLLLLMRRSVVEACRTRRQVLGLLAAPVVGAVAVGALVGHDWGYDGRVQFFAVPLTLALLATLCSSWVTAKPGLLRRGSAVLIFALLVGRSVTLSFPLEAVTQASKAAGFSVTPHTYAQTGRIVQRLGSSAGLRSVTVLTPDIGGLGLCCENLRVVDLAMLTNKQLARNGYSALNDVLLAESPEIVTAHWQWASLGKLYELPTFQALYVPVFAGQTKLWVRRDVAAKIEANGGCTVNLPAPRGLEAALATSRYASEYSSYDREAFDKRGAILVLDDLGAPQRWCRPRDTSDMATGQ